MKTTTLILEYLVSGIITLIAIIYILYVICPPEEFDMMKSAILWGAQAGNFFLVIILSIAYCLGIAIETSALSIFEGFLHKKSMIRLPKYYQDNKPHLKDSPFFLNVDMKKISQDKARKIYGNLRFYVLSKDPNLYKEIESQISRMRLIRVLFILEAIFFLGAVILLFQEYSTVLIIFTAVISFLLYSTYRAILTRFDRYFRAIERSYLIVSTV